MFELTLKGVFIVPHARNTSIVLTEITFGCRRNYENEGLANDTQCYNLYNYTSKICLQLIFQNHYRVLFILIWVIQHQNAIHTCYVFVVWQNGWTPAAPTVWYTGHFSNGPWPMRVVCKQLNKTKQLTDTHVKLHAACNEACRYSFSV